MHATPADPGAEVDRHYLDRVLETASVRDVEASEDIVAGNGMKLMAKGSRIDPAMRERLLQHKLRKPLEQCLVVADAATPQSLVPTAEALLDRHPFLRRLCTAERAQPVVESLAGLPLTPPLQSLLTVYLTQASDRAAHCVSAALVAWGLGRRLAPGDVEQQRTLLVAGLLHDVGELYIDPAILNKTTRLTPAQWRHIVTHPIVGHRVLRDMAGAGQAVAEAVLHHHERSDGHGYPNALRLAALPLAGQVLGAAECLAALMGSGREAVTHSSVASKVMPGEFHPALTRALTAISNEPSDDPAAAAPGPLADLAPRIARIAATLERFHDQRAWIEGCMARGSGAFSALLRLSVQRMERVQRAFSSAGLAGVAPEILLETFAALDDAALHRETTAIVRELEWRLRVLERDSLFRAGHLRPADEALMREVVARLTGRSVEAAADPTPA